MKMDDAAIIVVFFILSGVSLALITSNYRWAGFMFAIGIAVVTGLNVICTAIKERK